MASFLGDISGGQVYQHTLGRQRKPHAEQGRAHPFPAFRDRFIGQADHQKGRQAGGDLYLHFNRLGVDPGEGKGGDAGDGHACMIGAFCAEIQP